MGRAGPQDRGANPHGEIAFDVAHDYAAAHEWASSRQPRPQRADPAVPAEIPQRRRVHRHRPRRRARSASTTPSPSSGTPEEFVNDLEALGPTFVKIGQALSTRPDMVPPPTSPRCSACRTKCRRCPSRSCARWSRRNSACASTRRSLDFDEVPIGSASLAQVHRADAARRPRGRGEGAAPLRRRTWSARTSTRSPRSPARPTASPTSAAACASPTGCTSSARRCWPNSITASKPRTSSASPNTSPAIRNCSCPQPVRDLCSTRVLTMDLVHGTKVTALSGLRRTEQDMGLPRRSAAARLPRPDVRARRDPRRSAPGQHAGHRRRAARPVRPRHDRARAAEAARAPAQAVVRRVDGRGEEVGERIHRDGHAAGGLRPRTLTRARSGSWSRAMPRTRARSRCPKAGW